MSKIITKERILNEIRGINRREKVEASNYDKKDLNDEQIDQLITNNYKMDFLDDKDREVSERRKRIMQKTNIITNSSMSRNNSSGFFGKKKR